MLSVRHYLIGLVCLCGLGGFALAASFVTLQQKTHQLEVRINAGNSLRQEAVRLNDQIDQLLLAADLLFKAGNGYMQLPLNQQIDTAHKTLEQMRVKVPSPWRNELAVVDALQAHLSQLSREATYLDVLRSGFAPSQQRVANAQQIVEQLKRAGWALTISFGQRKEDLLALQRRHLQLQESWLMAGTALYLVLAVLALIWISRTVSQPITGLADQAARTSFDTSVQPQPLQEQPFHTPERTTREVRQLTTHMNDLVTLLKDRIHETQHLIRAMPDAMLLMNQNGDVLFCKSDLIQDADREQNAWVDALDESQRQQLIHSISSCQAEDRTETLRFNIADPSAARQRICEVRISPYNKGTAVLICRDLTESQKSEAHIKHLAYHDDLTGLLNRSAFLRYLNQQIADTPERKFALLFIDLDRFKWVNDTQGHDAGDFVLTHIANCLRSQVRHTDTVSDEYPQNSARIGGDEFLVLAHGIDNATNAQQMAQRLRDKILEPIDFGGVTLTVGASVGIALYPNHGQSADALIANADLAMFEAKRAGDSSVQLYANELGDRKKRRLSLETRLRNALSREELFLAYQPQVRIQDQQICGVEALVRWREDDQVISPAEFIALAEESGLIHPMGEFVLHHAATQLQQWDEMGLNIPRISVNVSAVQFKNNGVWSLLDRTLPIAAIDAHRITVEVTESVLMDDRNQAIRQIVALRETGVQFELDDFGTGYSSLKYLLDMPLDAIKIDRNFISGMPKDPAMQGIVETIVQLGARLGMRVVAEGVEVLAELEILRAFGCQVAQGYLFSPPVNATQLLEYCVLLQNRTASGATPDTPDLVSLPLLQSATGPSPLDPH